MAKKSRGGPPFDGKHIDTFTDVLAKAEPRPNEDSRRDEKKNYAQRLSAASAVLIANRLREFFPEILPTSDGKGAESPARTGKGIKRLDVNYSTVQLGLGLGVSIKTLNFKDPKTRRYTKNPTRIDNELRAEAMDYHERQPFSVLIAVVLLPLDACDDGDPKRPNSSSSFAQVVNVLRHRVNRKNPRDEAQLFEKGYVGLYEHDGARRGAVGFFDLSLQPPQFGKPDTIDWGPLVTQMTSVYDERNGVSTAWGKNKKPAPLKDLVQQEMIPDEDEDD